MFFLLLSLCSSTPRPVVMIPPLYGTNLFVTYERNYTDLNWYCPDSAHDELLWLGPKWVANFNCLFQLLQVFPGEGNHTFRTRTNVSISIHNFGLDDSVKYIVDARNVFSFVDTFKNHVVRPLYNYTSDPHYIEEKKYATDTANQLNSEIAKNEKLLNESISQTARVFLKESIKKMKSAVHEVLAPYAEEENNTDKYNFVNSFGPMIESLKNAGYVIGQDLFCAPYDWRFATVGLEDFWPQLINLIETAYEKNNHTKIAIFGFSCGGHILQLFLGQHTSQTWKDKFIDRAIFLAPSFGGAGESFYSLFTKNFPLAPFLKSQDLSAMIETMPVVNCHLPNHVVFGDTEIVRDDFDRKYTAADLRDLIVNQNRSTGDGIKVLDLCNNQAKIAPKPPGVPTYLIFNSGVPTTGREHFKKGFNKDPERKTMKGDGTVLAKGPKWASKNWPATGTFITIDVYRDVSGYHHMELIENRFIHDLIIDAITKDDWLQKKGRYFAVAPYVELIDNATQPYIIHDDIRPWSFKKTD